MPQELNLLGDSFGTCDDIMTIDIHAQDNSLVSFNYNCSTSDVEVSLKNDDHQYPIKKENITSDLSKIDSKEKFLSYFKNVFVKFTKTDNEDYSIKIHQKLKGGMMTLAQFKQSQQGSSPERVKTEQKLGIKINRGDALEHSLYDLYVMNGHPSSTSDTVHKVTIPHSSIYVGNDKVIGITNKGNHNGVVEKHNINADPVIDKYGKDPKYGMYNLETTAQRAESKLGKSSYYDLWYHNCHNFTNWCRTGVDYNSFGGKADQGIIFTYTTWDNI